MTRLTRPEASAGEATRLGEELRDGRLALGLSIEDVAASTRIRRPYLVALEEGRVRDLPAPAYAIGFVRTYAKALGLDDDAVVRRFREASGPLVQRKTDLIFPEAVPERGVPAGAVMLVGAVLAVGAYLGWHQWSGSGTRTVDAVPPVPARLEQVAGPAREPTPPPPAAPAASLPPPLPPPAAAAASVVAQPVDTRPPVVPAAEPRVLLRAKAETWVQVRDTRAGTVIMNRVLKPGEAYAVPAREGLMLSTGNAGGLDILVDGQVAPGLGAAQAVRRDVPLEPDRMRSGIPVPIPVTTTPPPPAPRPVPQ